MLNTWMSDTAKQIIIDNLKPNDIMLEFGSGSSTLEFSIINNIPGWDGNIS